MTHPGISQYEHRRQYNLRLIETSKKEMVLCPRCGGTGNELYAMYRDAMYRGCRDCRAIGLLAKSKLGEWDKYGGTAKAHLAGHCDCDHDK